MSELLAVQGLRAGYGDTVVLEDVALSLPERGTLAVLGRNGVGKTTLLASLMGHTTRHGGDIRLRGRDIAGLPVHLRARAGIGYVPQAREIFPSLSVEENLVVAARAQRRPLEPGAGLRPLSPPRGAPLALREPDLGRRAADARDRPGAHGQPVAAADGRAARGPRADHRRGPAGRAEAPHLRGGARDGARGAVGAPRPAGDAGGAGARSRACRLRRREPDATGRPRAPRGAGGRPVTARGTYCFFCVVESLLELDGLELELELGEAELLEPELGVLLESEALGVDVDELPEALGELDDGVLLELEPELDGVLLEPEPDMAPEPDGVLLEPDEDDDGDDGEVEDEPADEDLLLPPDGPPVRSQP